MSKKHKCYISYKFEDKQFRDRIVEKFSDIAFVDKSQQKTIDSDNPDTIMRAIRDNWLNDSTVTIYLIGTRSFENYQKATDTKKGYKSQVIVKGELMATLSVGKDGKRRGLLGVVLPQMESRIFIKKDKKSKEYKVNLNNNTVLEEFSQNYNGINGFVVLVRYCEFMNNPDLYINMAYNKRNEFKNNSIRVRRFKKD